MQTQAVSYNIQTFLTNQNACMPSPIHDSAKFATMLSSKNNKDIL